LHKHASGRAHIREPGLIYTFSTVGLSPMQPVTFKPALHVARRAASPVTRNIGSAQQKRVFIGR
jgi:hypothetical protein